MKKSNVLEAIKLLITRYESFGHLNHGRDYCPLCRIFIIEMNGFILFDSNKECTTCPNLAFKDSTHLYHSQKACSKRGKVYNRLDFTNYECKENLAAFWTAVLIYLSDQTEEDVEEMNELLKLQIRRIAEHYNR